MELTFITGNSAKAEQLGRFLNHPVKHHQLDLIEVQSLDLAEITKHKAKEAFRQINQPVLVEDTALTFNALGRLPGPLVKWFLTELGNDGLCRLLDVFSDRMAVAEVVFGLFDGSKLQTFEGRMEGSIADRPRGEQGFGWDPIFIPKGCQKTWSEMTQAEQAETSMRRIALEKLQLELKNLL